jgi:hypothetical protein
MLKKFKGIFAMCHRTDQHLDVIEQCMEIVRHNQEIIHNQRDEPLLEFPNVLVYPPIADPYASLTPTELAAFGVGPLMLLPTATMMMKTRRPPTMTRRPPTMTRRPRTTSSPLASALFRLFSLFDVLTTKGEKRVISIHHFSFLVCNGQSCTYGGCIMGKYFYVWTTLMACITLYNIVPIMLSLYVWMSFMLIYLVCQ